jgi:prepilin-type processing-associated H-X9-DG protein
MKRQGSMRSAPALLAIGAALAAFAPSSRAGQMYDLPPYSAAVEKAVSAENLKAIAMKSNDPEVLLGLDFLVRPGNAARQEIAEMAVKAKPDYAPIVAVVAVRMDAIDEKTVAELIKSDPDNGYGYYLQGYLLYGAEKEQDALAAFQKGAACRELRLYENVTAPAVFKALDALDLKGRDRVYAFSWLATRATNADIIEWQAVIQDLRELTQKADLSARKEISEILLLLAGQLYTTNFLNRTFAGRALESAFRYKAEVAAAEKSPAMNGYASVTQALTSVQAFAAKQPGFLGIKTLTREVAEFLPDRIYRAFTVSDPSHLKQIYGWDVAVPESDRPALEKAQENAVGAAKTLIEAALTAPDEIVGAYLKGLPPPRKDGTFPWVSFYTYPERVMINRPDVVKAAMANEEAMAALYDASKNDIRQKNAVQMLKIGIGFNAYSGEHGNTFPDSLSVLFEKKYLEPPITANSLLTGRPYVYVAAGERWPEKSAEAGRFILIYDDQISDGRCNCLMPDGHVAFLPVDRVREQLRKQGKQGP